MQKFKGKIIAISEVEKGNSSKGKEWQKITFLVEELTGKYPQKAAFVLFGEDKVSGFKQKVDDIVEVDYNISSNEYKGKFYTSLNAWRVEANNVGGVQQELIPTDDLPFC